jgi:N-acetylglutamate synthase-like GNAT family acetyltransferase
MDAITIQIISADSPLYQQVWQVREDVLRRPLGRSLKNEDLSMDAQDVIFTAIQNSKVVGCVILHTIDLHQMKLRAMAVYPQWQGKSIGRLLVQHAERYVKEQDYKKIVLHARKVAAIFYSKLGYSIASDEFTEVGLPHVLMGKLIS